MGNAAGPAGGAALHAGGRPTGGQDAPLHGRHEAAVLGPAVAHTAHCAKNKRAKAQGRSTGAITEKNSSPRIRSNSVR